MLDIDLAFRSGKIVEIEQAGFEAGLQLHLRRGDLVPGVTGLD